MDKVHPILFNTDMVRAILSGRKTVTRRLVKPQPRKSMIHKLGYCVDGDKEDIGKYGFGSLECGGHVRYVKPPCQPGDILYVRETWNTKCKHCESECTAPCSAPYYVYKADYPYTEDKWRPSIHMPKEAARIWLKVADIQPEQLHDINDNEVKAEGLAIGCYFDDIWNSTIKKTDISRYGWNANPWVWVIRFERCEKPEKWLKEG